MDIETDETIDYCYKKYESILVEYGIIILIDIRQLFYFHII